MSKITVVTGASSGIGERVALDLVKQGNPVVLIARRKDYLDKIIERESLTEKQAIAIACDVSVYEAFEKAILDGIAHFKKVLGEAELDLLVNNAGIMPLSQISVMNPETYTQMVNINVLGVMHGMTIASKIMIPLKTGTIINVSSIAGRKSFPNHAYYNATKFGVHGMSETVRNELRPHNIRVTIVAPGAVRTNLLDASNDDNTITGYRQWIDNSGGQILLDEDVSSSILYAYNAPQRVVIREIVLAGISQDDN